MKRSKLLSLIVSPAWLIAAAAAFDPESFGGPLLPSTPTHANKEATQLKVFWLSRRAALSANVGCHGGTWVLALATVFLMFLNKHVRKTLFKRYLLLSSFKKIP